MGTSKQVEGRVRGCLTILSPTYLLLTTTYLLHHPIITIVKFLDRERHEEETEQEQKEDRTKGAGGIVVRKKFV